MMLRSPGVFSVAASAEPVCPAELQVQVGLSARRAWLCKRSEPDSAFAKMLGTCMRQWHTSAFFLA